MEITYFSSKKNLHEHLRLHEKLHFVWQSITTYEFQKIIAREELQK